MGIKDVWDKCKEKATDLWDSTKDTSLLLKANLEDKTDIVKDKINKDW